MSIKDFHVSTAKELIAVKDKVRNLVNHWPEDGRHKEVVLKTVIKRFLPEKYKVGSGFVVKQTHSRENHLSSKQIDLIIYNIAYPVLFKEGDFVILTPDAVDGIVEVKTNLTNNISDTLKKANENGKFIYTGKNDNAKIFFNGIFSFEGNKYNNKSIKSTIEEAERLQGYNSSNKYIVNHICFNENLFYKYWGNSKEYDGDLHYLYKIPDLSFAFFISNLMDYLAPTSVINNSKLWFGVDKSFNVESKWRS